MIYLAKLMTEMMLEYPIWMRNVDRVFTGVVIAIFVFTIFLACYNQYRYYRG